MLVLSTDYCFSALVVACSIFCSYYVSILLFAFAFLLCQKFLLAKSMGLYLCVCVHACCLSSVIHLDCL